MRARLRLAIAILALIAVAACSDNSTAPDGGDRLDRLAGVWHVVSATWGQSTIDYPEGSTYWHFKNDGQYYIETRTGHGYGVFACGQVTPRFFMTVVCPSGTVEKSRLVLSEDGESLRSLLVEATGPAADRYDLLRTTDRETMDLDCE